MRYLIISILILVAAAVGWLMGRQYTGVATPDVDTINSSTGDEESRRIIRCQGKFVPEGGIVKILAPVGEKIEFLTQKKVGESVKKGEVLVRLFSRKIRQQELLLAEARLADAMRKAEFEKQQADFKKKAADLAVEEAADSADQIARESQKIELLATQHETALELLNRLKSLKEDPDTAQLIDKTELSKQQLLVDQLAMQMEQGKSDVVLAKQAATRAKQLADNQLSAIEFSLDNANQAIPLESLKTAIELARVAFDSTEIKSPVDGDILDIIVRQGDSATDRPVMVIANTDQMQCLAEVNDSLIRHIDLSSNTKPRAQITSPALRDEIWGTVVNKGVMISPPSLKDPNPFANVDRRTATLTIELDNSDQAAELVNLQVDVAIEVIPGSLKGPDQ